MKTVWELPRDDMGAVLEWTREYVQTHGQRPGPDDLRVLARLQSTQEQSDRLFILLDQI